MCMLDAYWFSGELASAVSVLQLFCSSPKPALRFAAVRTLNRISINYPQAVISCNVDLEQLITDQNRSIATLAITTLLKTGAENSVERLMKQIGTFVNEISDEFKVNIERCIEIRIPNRNSLDRCHRSYPIIVWSLPAKARHDDELPCVDAARRGRVRVQEGHCGHHNRHRRRESCCPGHW